MSELVSGRWSEFHGIDRKQNRLYGGDQGRLLEGMVFAVELENLDGKQQLQDTESESIRLDITKVK